MTDIHAIIDMMKSDPKGVSLKFGIPLRTVYGWCNGSRKAPVYIINMMLNILLLERRIAIYGNEKEGLEEGMGSSLKGVQEACKKSKPENEATGDLC